MTVKGRILFVDDDPGCLDELRRQTALLSGEWEPTFLGSASEGLLAFEDKPFQVVAADLRMPGMDGSEFLQEVMARYPGTIRVLVADEADRDLVLQSVGRTHRFLAKPLEMAIVKYVLDCSAGAGLRVGNHHVRELITRIGQLPAVPDLYRQITTLMESEHDTLEQLGAIIGQDIAMTAMILKLANSAFFSLRHPVTSPAEAVSFLGIDLLRALVLAHGLFGQVGAFRVPGFTLQNLWGHSLSVAAGTRLIAEAEGLGAHRANEYFTAGLLHDIGVLILASRFPEDYAKVLETSLRTGSELEASEYHVFGATHGEVGAYLLALWGIPEPIVQAAACHHNISRQAERGFSPALAVHVADTVHAYNPEHQAFSRARLDETYLAGLGLQDRLPVWFEAVKRGSPTH